MKCTTDSISESVDSQRKVYCGRINLIQGVAKDQFDLKRNIKMQQIHSKKRL